MKSENICIKPKGIMYIVTIICGFFIFSLSFYLFIISLIYNDKVNILISLFGIFLVFNEIKKMLKYKIIIDCKHIFITKQNFSFKIWQTDFQTINISDVQDIYLKNVFIVIKSKQQFYKIWILPFNKNQINTIILTIKRKAEIL